MRPPRRIVEAPQTEGLAKPGAGGVFTKPRAVDRETPLALRKDKFGKLRAKGRK